MSYDFADRLIEMRRSRGLSQEELAKDLGLSRQAVSKWERAESAPDIGNLVALANIYDVTLDELVRGVDEVEVAEIESEATSDGVSVEEAVEVVEVVETVESAAYGEGDENASAGEVVEMAEAVDTDGSAETVDSFAARSETTAVNVSAPDGTSEANAAPPPSQGASAADETMPPPPAGAVPVQIPVETPAQPHKQRNPLYTFPYALLVALIYLVMGFVFGLWHPGWVIFLTIPFYYWIASVITHDPEFEAKHTQYYGPRESHSQGHRGPYSE